MRIALVSNLTNGVGLERDYRLLRALIEKLGHSVTGIQFNKPKPRTRFDLVIFSETYVPGWEDLAPCRWAIPNPEWWFWNDAVPMFDRVLCKTRDTERIFKGLGGKTVYTGFGSASRHNAKIPHERRFLHVAGDSETKGTEAVIKAWKDRRPKADLIIVGRRVRLRTRIPGLTLHKRLEEGRLRDLQNRCAFHLQPSEYEGFGHVVWEALSTGGVIAVPDAPPLNEIGVALKIPVASTRTMQAATTSQVSAEGVKDVVERMMWMPDHEIEARGVMGRFAHHEMNEGFERIMREML